MEWKEMSQEEIDKTRMKAYLSFDEMEMDPNVDTSINYYYINSKGDKVKCNVIYSRDNGEVIVVNENSCQVMLTKDKLYIDI